jgi:hypothetical protein
MQRTIRTIVLVFAVLALSLSLIAQTETGQISGTVTDPSGAIVPNAKVTVTNVGTGQARTANSSSSGQYAFTNLQPGSYSVKVAATGFADFQQRVDVVVGSRSTVDPHLSVNTSGTVVEVMETAGAQVDTQTQTLGQTVTPQQMTELPSLTRNPYDFVVTAGNVSEGDNGGRGVGVSINGQRSASTNILLDGAENVDLFTAQVGQQVPIDSVQEYKILTSDFTAEYGRASGGVVNVSTKSGTNAFHGSAYEYNRISALASNTYDYNAQSAANIASGGAALPKANFTRNQFGFAVGGPIVKNKLFFFTNTEWTRVRSSQNTKTYIFDPTFIARTGAATQSFYSAYGKSATGVSQIGAPITAGQIMADQIGGLSATKIAAGSPNFAALAAGSPNQPVFDLVNYNVPNDSGAGAPQNTYNSVSRVDFNFTDRTTLWGRYAIYNEIDFAGFVGNSPYAGFNTGQTQRNQNIVANLTHIFSTSIVNQVKLSYNRLNLLQPLGTQPAVPSAYIAGSVPNLTGVSTGTASIAMPGYLPFSQGNAIPFGGPQNLYQVSDQFSWTKGNHSLVFGGEYLHTRDNRVFGAFEEGIADVGRTASLAFDNLLNGTIFGYQIAINPQAFPCTTDPATGALNATPGCTLNLPSSLPAFNRHNHYNDGAAYGQDSWRATKRLTLNFGLRWEYFGVQHNTNPSLDSNFYYPGVLSPAAVRNGFVSTAPQSPVGGLWNPSKKNFGPRIGLAYDLTGDGKTSLRGGYGISYERNFGNVTFNVIQNPPNYGVVQLTNSTTGFPFPTANLGPFAGTGTKPLPPVTLRGVDPNIKTAYADQYSVAIERQVINNTVVAVEYSGSRGIHQYSITNVNRFGGAYSYNGDPVVPGNCDQAGGALECGRTNFQYGNINFRGSNGDSWYNGMNVRAQSNNFQNKGLQFTFNYTWSHSIDDLSSTFSETNSGGVQGSLGFLDWRNPKFDKADSDYDARHRVSFSAVYQPTFLNFKSKLLTNTIGGWSFAPIWTWHTGTPFTLYDCFNAFGICSRPLVVDTAGKTMPLLNTGPNVFNYFQYGSYTPYAATINGVSTGYADDPSCTNGVCSFPSTMLRRNSARVPNVWNMNLGVYKNFKVGERLGLQLRGEAYNLFNHSNYYLNYGDTDMENGGLVTVNKGNGVERRNVQLALRLTF